MVVVVDCGFVCSKRNKFLEKAEFFYVVFFSQKEKKKRFPRALRICAYVSREKKNEPY